MVRREQKIFFSCLVWRMATPTVDGDRKSECGNASTSHAPADINHEDVWSYCVVKQKRHTLRPVNLTSVAARNGSYLYEVERVHATRYLIDPKAFSERARQLIAARKRKSLHSSDPDRVQFVAAATSDSEESSKQVSSDGSSKQVSSDESSKQVSSDGSSKQVYGETRSNEGDGNEAAIVRTKNARVSIDASVPVSSASSVTTSAGVSTSFVHPLPPHRLLGVYLTADGRVLGETDQKIHSKTVDITNSVLAYVPKQDPAHGRLHTYTRQRLDGDYNQNPLAQAFGVVDPRPRSRPTIAAPPPPLSSPPPPSTLLVTPLLSQPPSSTALPSVSESQLSSTTKLVSISAKAVVVNDAIVNDAIVNGAIVNVAVVNGAVVNGAVVNGAVVNGGVVRKTLGNVVDAVNSRTSAINRRVSEKKGETAKKKENGEEGNARQEKKQKHEDDAASTDAADPAKRLKLTISTAAPDITFFAGEASAQTVVTESSGMTTSTTTGASDGAATVVSAVGAGSGSGGGVGGGISLKPDQWVANLKRLGLVRGTKEDFKGFRVRAKRAMMVEWQRQKESDRVRRKLAKEQAAAEKKREKEEKRRHKLLAAAVMSTKNVATATTNTPRTPRLTGNANAKSASERKRSSASRGGGSSKNRKSTITNSGGGSGGSDDAKCDPFRGQLVVTRTLHQRRPAVFCTETQARHGMRFPEVSHSIGSIWSAGVATSFRLQELAIGERLSLPKTAVLPSYGGDDAFVYGAGQTLCTHLNLHYYAHLPNIHNPNVPPPFKRLPGVSTTTLQKQLASAAAAAATTATFTLLETNDDEEDGGGDSIAGVTKRANEKEKKSEAVAAVDNEKKKKTKKTVRAKGNPREVKSAKGKVGNSRSQINEPIVVRDGCGNASRLVSLYGQVPPLMPHAITRVLWNELSRDILYVTLVGSGGGGGVGGGNVVERGKNGDGDDDEDDRVTTSPLVHAMRSGRTTASVVSTTSNTSSTDVLIRKRVVSKERALNGNAFMRSALLHDPERGIDGDMAYRSPRASAWEWLGQSWLPVTVHGGTHLKLTVIKPEAETRAPNCFAHASQRVRLRDSSIVYVLSDESCYCLAEPHDQLSSASPASPPPTVLTGGKAKRPTTATTSTSAPVAKKRRVSSSSSSSHSAVTILPEKVASSSSSHVPDIYPISSSSISTSLSQPPSETAPSSFSSSAHVNGTAVTHASVHTVRKAPSPLLPARTAASSVGVRNTVHKSPSRQTVPTLTHTSTSLASPVAPGLVSKRINISKSTTPKMNKMREVTT
jgi:hypothetical protein